jgi:hypothetical protein
MVPTGLLQRIGEDHIFPTLPTAVERSLPGARTETAPTTGPPTGRPPTTDPVGYELAGCTRTIGWSAGSTTWGNRPAYVALATPYPSSTGPSTVARPARH